MRFLCAALAGVFAVLFLPAQAIAAPLVPAVTIKMEPRYLTDQGSFYATAVLAGGTSNVNGVLYFRRYADPSCSGPYDNIGGVGVSGNKEYPSPNLQSGALGDFGLTVFFDSSNTSANADQTSACVKYLRQQRTSTQMQLPKSRYDAPARLEPQVTLSGAQAGAAAEFERFASSDCTGTARVVTTEAVSDEVIGTHSVRAVYRGTDTLAESVSPCRSYVVGTYIRGRVFQDIDNNGTFDEGEAGLAGVSVTLRKGGADVETTQTAADGKYEFYVTSAGDYAVVQAQPSGFDSTTPDEIPLQVTGVVLVDNNFGESSAVPPDRPLVTEATGTSPPAIAADEGGTGLALLRFAALALIVLAVVALMVLLYAARARRGEEF